MNNRIIRIGCLERTEFHSRIEKSISELIGSPEDTGEAADKALEAVRDAMLAHDSFIIPIELPEKSSDAPDPDGSQSKDAVGSPDELRYKVRMLNLKNGGRVFAAFTSLDEVRLGENTSTSVESIEDFLGGVMLSPDNDGVILNPWGSSFYLSKGDIEQIFRAAIPCRPEFTIAFFDCDPSGIEVAYHAPRLRASEIGNGDVIWNELEKMRRNRLCSAAFPIFEADGYPMEDAVDSALGTLSDWVKINGDFGAAICFAGSDEAEVSLFRKIWDKYERAWNERVIIHENDGRLEKAAELAMEFHKSANYEKSELLHRLETVQILGRMNADANLLCAGMLLDTPGENESALLEIYRRFGTDTAALVKAGAEDKRRCWYMRKLRRLTLLPDENIRVKLLVMADELSELRRLSSEHKKPGGEVWESWDVSELTLAWYFSGVIDALSGMQDYPETSELYWEMNAIYKDLFVRFYFDVEKELIYQADVSGSVYILKKGDPEWTRQDGVVPEGARQISRRYAERLEDNWQDGQGTDPVKNFGSKNRTGSFS